MAQNYFETTLPQRISKLAKAIAFFLPFILASNSQASTYTVTANISWSNLRTLVTPNADPTSSDNLSLTDAFILTIDVSNAVIGSPVVSHMGTVFFNSGSQLTIGSGAGMFNLGASGGSTRRGIIDMTNGGTLNCYGISTGNAANEFISGTGTVHFSYPTGSTAPSIITTFNNLIISGNTTRTLSGATTINGNLTINAGSTLATQSAYDITLKGNWINNGAFTQTIRTVTLSGTSTQTIGGSASTTFNNLVISNTNGAVLAVNTTVNANLNLSGGSLTLSTFNLTLASAATITNYTTAKYIITNNDPLNGGFLIQRVIGADKVFPVGTTNYTPVTLNNSGTAEDFRVRVFIGVYGNGTTGSLLSRGVNRTWLVEKVGAAGVSITMTLQWNDIDEDLSFTRGNCAVFHYTSGSWDDPSSFAPAGGLNPYTVSRSGITTFSPFGVGDDIEPLPVELISFEANRSDKNNNEIKLEWVTAAEINNSHFAIERSADGKSFETIDIVEGAGNSNSLLSYTYSDMDPLQQNISYYRLKQVNFDGTSSYSYVQVIKAITAFLTIGDAYPIPALETVNIPMQNLNDLSGPLGSAGNWVVEIHKLSGGLVYSETLNLSAGSQMLSLPVADLPQGLYIVSISNSSENHSLKLIK